jgi:hypothetical protein
MLFVMPFLFVFYILSRTHLSLLYRGRWGEMRTNVYVTDGNIMYLTDASRFLISCVIQHYAPVVRVGEVEEQMHNVDYDPGP